MKAFKNNNLSLLIDLYELTMAQSYFDQGMDQIIAGFDCFYRKNPDNASFAIMGGVEELVHAIENFTFTEDDLQYLASLDLFNKPFLSYLKNFKFTGDLWAIEEGSVIFPSEPLVKIKAPLIEAQLIETMVILLINRGSLFTTKANRIARQIPQENLLLEFGARRSQGIDIPIYAPRYAYIGGFDGTSSTIAGKAFNIPVAGTMAHSYIMCFDSEYEAFVSYCESYPENTILLVDTYDTIKSGIPNAIKAFDNVLKPKNIKPKGIRLDSGDLADLSKKARVLLDEAGYEECKIFASNSLDEELIQSLRFQEAKIDGYGVGERFATSKSSPVFGAVYKLCYLQYPDGTIKNKLKLSDNPEKLTNPGNKKIFRVYDKDNKAYADVITLSNETIDSTNDLTLFDPIYKHKKTKFNAGEFKIKELLKPIFKDGRCIYDLPDIEKIRAHCQKEINSLYEGVKRLKNPHKYYVDLSEKLLTLKTTLLKEEKKKTNL